MGIARARASGTKPVGHAVSGEGIVIIAQARARGAAADDLTIFDPPGPAEANPPFRNTAGVETEGAGFALGVLGRSKGKVKGPAAFVVQLFNFGPDLGKMGADARRAIAQAGGDKAVGLVAMSAGTHERFYPDNMDKADLSNKLLFRIGIRQRLRSDKERICFRSMIIPMPTYPYEI